MPLYSYQCLRCGHPFDKLQAFVAEAPVCPKCSGPSKKRLTAPAVKFKGSGFYETDFKNKA